jgi:hypothetical protein
MNSIAEIKQLYESDYLELHWLISALSGTVEIEKQTAWLVRSNEELRKNNAELSKKNKRLAELELKEILHS